uniref:Coatomer subunit beta'-3 n=1 Tax=Triticum urartu TaxID=4572 RepID=A0A8R7RFF4_TRIUA
MTMKRVKEFKAHHGWVTSLAVHPTQPFVLSASSDKLIKLWNWEKGWECIRTFTGHLHWVNQVKFNPHDANTFASASYDGTVKIWRILSPTHFSSLNCERVQACVDYYPTCVDQQHYIVTGSVSNINQIWDLRTQTCISEIKGLQDPCSVGVIDCHPDRPAVLVTASKSYCVSLHDSTTYRCERTVNFGLSEVVCFANIKATRSLAIGHKYGVAIVEIDRFFKEVPPPTR